MFDKLKQLDFYRRIPRDLTESTLHGSVLSLCAGTFMSILFLVELSAFLSTTTETQIIVDQNIGEQLRINFNITLMDLSCEYAAIDMVDVLGTNRLNVTRNIEKWQLDEHGMKKVFAGRNREQRDLAHDFHSHPEIELLHQDGVHAVKINEDAFSSWLENHEYTFANFYAPWCVWCQRLEPTWEAFAELAEKDQLPVSIIQVDCQANSQLCGTLRVQAFPTLRFFKKSDVQPPDYKMDRTVDALMAYTRSRLDQDENLQKLPEERRKAVEQRVMKDHPGCMITGYILVNRVPGNFHLEARSKHHNLNAATTNLSHIVHELSFGPILSGTLLERLKTVPEVFTHTHTMNNNMYVNEEFHEAYHHYIKVVPTHYEVSRLYQGKRSILAYQMLEQSQNMRYHEDDVPEARFSYDISPMAVVVSKKSKRWYEFVTSVCAIIGGTFTVLSLLNSVLSVVFKAKKL